MGGVEPSDLIGAETMVQWLEILLTIYKALHLTLVPPKLATVVHTCNSNIQEVEAEGSQVKVILGQDGI